jgi:hypothetical protein
MPSLHRPAMPEIPDRLDVFRARRQYLASQAAMVLAVVVALTGVLIVAAAAVALAIT